MRITTVARLLVLVSALTLLPPAASVAAAPSASQLEGILTTDHGDDVARGRAVQYRVLETAGERLTIEGRGAQGLPDGARVKLRGQRQGNRLLLAEKDPVVAMSTSGDSTGTYAANTTTTTNIKRLAVLLVNFQSDQRQPWTRAGARSVVFDGASSAAAYWHEVSNGHTSFSGDVFGYFTLSNSTTSCDYNSWMSAGKSAAKAAGVDLSRYSNVMLAFPRQSACWWSGLGQLPGANTWMNGRLTTFLAVHELGHNMGAHHASTLSCKDSAGQRVAFSNNCTRSEYGDPFDVMGKNTRHGNSWHRRQWGFLGSAHQKTVTASGNYTIAPAAKAGGSPRILRVARPAGNFFYVEFRQPYGTFDSFSTTAPAVNGVMIRLAPDTSRVPSKLIDTTPATTSFADAPLALGRTFVDPISRISITVVSLNQSGATLRVAFGSGGGSVTPSDTTAPSAPGNLQASASGENSATLSWTAATDNVGVAGYRVLRDGAAIATLGPSARSLADAGLTAGRRYVYEVLAFDAAGNGGPAATTSYSVPMAPDTTAPTIPGNLRGEKEKHKVLLRWEASADNSGSVQYQVFRGTLHVATVSATNYSDAGKADTYAYTVRAIDPSGNLSPLSNTVTLRLGH